MNCEMCLGRGKQIGSGADCPVCTGTGNVPDKKLSVAVLTGSREYAANVMEDVFQECRGLRGAGQKEYAHDEQNAFGNFERLAEALGIPREKVLLTYYTKHHDGVLAWANGHRSQREDVRGRINDMIVYLCLLRGMIEQDTF